MALIFLGSSLPSHDLPGGVGDFDKVLHTLEYGALGALVCFAAGRHRPRALVIGALVASLYGASDELHQLFVAGRSCDALDWIADSVGGTLGAMACFFFRQRS